MVNGKESSQASSETMPRKGYARRPTHKKINSAKRWKGRSKAVTPSQASMNKRPRHGISYQSLEAEPSSVLIVRVESKNRKDWMDCGTVETTDRLDWLAHLCMSAEVIG